MTSPIVALKLIGVSLSDIKRLLRSERHELTAVLAAQRIVLEEKRRRLDLAIAAVREAQGMERQQLDPSRMRRIVEVINMQHQRTEWKSYTTRSCKAKSSGCRRCHRRLANSSVDSSPNSPRRFKESSTKTRQGHALRNSPDGGYSFCAFAPKGDVDPQLLKYGAAYLSDGGWRPGASQPEPPFGRPIWEFMARALAARR